MIDLNRDLICVNGCQAEIYKVISNQPFLYMGAVKLEDEQWYPCSWDIHGKPSKLDPGLRIVNEPKKETIHFQVFKHTGTGELIGKQGRVRTTPGPAYVEVYYKPATFPVE